jgi:hypothetical protein
MKRGMAVIFLLLLAAVAVAQDPSVLTTIIDDFRGLTSGAPTDLSPTLPMDIVNFDFHTAGDGAPVSIRKRNGFETKGTAQLGSTGGLYKWNNQLLASFGRDLYVYSTTFNDWRNAGTSPLAAKCAVTNGSDTVHGITSAWWMPSMQTYDSLVIDGVQYPIRKIYSDTLIILGTVYAGATSTSVSCNLTGGSSSPASLPFASAASLKPGLVYNDSLYIFTATERVAYGGGQAAAFITPKKVDSVLDWRRSDMTLRLKGISLAVANSWVQLQVKRAVPPFNLALWCAEATPTAIRLRCDTNLAEKIIRPGYPYYATQLSASHTFSNICSTLVTTVEKDSVDAGTTPLSSTWEYARCSTRVTGFLVDQYIGRQKSFAPAHYYIYRYKIRGAVACSSATWPKDSLTWMTTVAKSKWADSGLYRLQIPVLRDSDGTGPYLAISTIGKVGVGVVVDSTPWVGVSTCEANQQAICGTVLCWHGDYANRRVFPNAPAVRRTHGAVDWVVWNPHAKLGIPRWCPCASSSYDSPLCEYIDSAVFICFGPLATSATLLPDGGSTAFKVGDTIVVKKMTRIAKAALPSSVKAWSTWTYPIATMLFDRMWLSGAAGYPNLVTATKDKKPDEIAVTTQVNVYENDGSYITALWADQNIIYVGKPIGIYQMPINTTTGATGSGVVALEPAGVFPTRSTCGPLNQNGVAKWPYGWAFSSFDGVYSFDGSNSDLISGAITDFWRDSLDVASISLATTIYDYGKNRLMVSVTQKGQSVNSTTLVYDLTAKAWTRYSIGARFWSIMSYPTDKPVLYWGAPDQSTGRICYMSDVPSDSGVSFSARWRSGWLTLGGRMGERVSPWEWMLEMKRSPNTTVTLDVFRDGSNTTSHTGVIWGKSHIEAAAVIADGGDPTYQAITGGLTNDTLSLWTTRRNSFPTGLGAERMSFSLEVIPTNQIIAFWLTAYGADVLSGIPIDDSCEISGLRLDYVPEGKSPW